MGRSEHAERAPVKRQKALTENTAAAAEVTWPDANGASSDDDFE